MKSLTRFFVLLLFSAICLAVTGCAAGVMEEAAENRNPKDIRVGKDLLHAFMTGNEELFMKELPPEVQESFSRNDFRKTRESMIQQFGTPVSYRYVMNLQHPLAVISVWRLRFEQEKSDKSGKFPQEILFRAAYGTDQKTGKQILLSFNFL